MSRLWLGSDADRAIARRILLRLIQFGEGRADTRRQQTAEQLHQGASADRDFDHVLAVLTDNRLLTLSDRARHVDLSHEALIGGWPRLRQWIDERRAAELTRRRLEEQAAERLRLRRNDAAGGLLDVVELAEAEAWINSPDAVELGVSDELRSLVADSRRAIDDAALERERAAERLRKRNQGLAIALAAALVAVAVAVVFFFSAQNEAQDARDAQVIAQANADEAATQAAIAQANEDEANSQRATAEANAVEANSQRATASAERATAEARRIEAEAAQQEAEQEKRRAQAENLTTLATVRMQRDGVYDDVSLLLARDAVLSTWNLPDQNVTVNAEAALRAAMDRLPWRMTLPSAQERHQGAVNSVAFSPDRATMASVGSDGAIRLWEAGTLEPISILEGHTDDVRSVAFSPDGGTLASGSDDSSVRLWDVRTGEQLRTLEGHADTVNTVAFSPDGSTLASGGNDSSVRLWDVQTGEQMQTLEGHTDFVFSVAFSPDGSTLASGGGDLEGTDNTVRLWDVRTGKQLQTLKGHTDLVRSVAFSPDGSTLASGGDDSTVRLWPVTLDALLRMAEQRIQRPAHLLTGTERRELGLEQQQSR